MFVQKDQVAVGNRNDSMEKINRLIAGDLRALVYKKRTDQFAKNNPRSSLDLQPGRWTLDR